jgi:hypothetical protein
MADKESPPAGVSGIAPGNSPGPVLSADSAQPVAAPATPAPSESVTAGDSSSQRPTAYEGSEPSLLQSTAAKEPPKADAKPAEAGAADGTKPAEGTKPSAETKDAKTDPAKPGEAAKPEGDAAKPAEAKLGPDGKPIETPKEPEKPAAVDYKYALPETVKLDDTKKTELHGLLDAFRADPANVQPLIDYHAARMAEHATAVDAHNRNVFNEMRQENRKAIMADPVLGGSGHQTTAQAVARMRDLLIPQDMLQPRQFDDGKPRLSIADEFLESTGAGDHPVLWHILHNAARYLDEPQAKDMPANVRPPKNHGKPPKGGLRQLYDHPRSNNGQS